MPVQMQGARPLTLRSEDPVEPLLTLGLLLLPGDLRTECKGAFWCCCGGLLGAVSLAPERFNLNICQAAPSCDHRPSRWAGGQ